MGAGCLARLSPLVPTRVLCRHAFWHLEALAPVVPTSGVGKAGGALDHPCHLPCLPGQPEATQALVTLLSRAVGRGGVGMGGWERQLRER